jgi:phosphoglycerol transferase MdoB-like AlkP superfamily enzyme
MQSALRQAKPWLFLIQPFAIAYLVIQTLTRIGLLIYSGQAGDMAAWQWPTVFSVGLLFDIQVLGFFLLPIIFIHLFVSYNGWRSKPMRALRYIWFFIYTYTWLFTTVSEYFFWEEFGTRFNFIAVDYLVYTTEVIGNIQQSYPVYPLLGIILVITIGITLLLRRKLSLDPRVTPFGRLSRIWAPVLVAVPVILCLTVPIFEISNNEAIQEVSTNGTYDLFSAFRNNELSYKKFYLTHDEKSVATNIRHLLEEDENDFVNNDPNDITRVIKMKGPEIHKNVVVVVMESMSADFMGIFGNPNGLTPNLDALSKKGLFFPKFYATGTRTVRGLEAVTLSIPPTPGQSIVRRPNNDNLFSLGFVFQDRGYDTAFIYGGHGYFDNMNEFFSHNGFDIIDRPKFAPEDVTFSNAWGVCDEDLYNQVLKQADTSFNKDKKFMFEVMTTSNHRPYTYPDGKIDIPSKSGGRKGGVKYADYAVGQFLKEAAKKPWFKDTVFVFVADHTAGAGGKIDLSMQKYHIPAIIYAPGFVKPKKYDSIASQIDIAPTLLGALNFSYYTKFYGEDLINDADEPENAHAFISNYQKMGYLKDGQLTVLEPMDKIEYFSGENVMPKEKRNNTLLIDTVTYYQYASGWKERMKRIPTVVKK